MSPPLSLRLAYSSRELSSHSFVFLNDRTLLFPVGLHLFKFDVGSQSIAAAAIAAAAANQAQTTAGGTPLLPDTRTAGLSTAALVAAPLAGVGLVAGAGSDASGSNPGMSATGCMEFFFRRSYAINPTIAISRNRAKMAICEDMEYNPGSAAAAASSQHMRGGGAGGLHHANTGGGLSGAYKKAMISIIDLTVDPPILCWQFHHHHAGRIESVDFSANGNLIAVCVELDQADTIGLHQQHKRETGSNEGAAKDGGLGSGKKRRLGAASTERLGGGAGYTHPLTEDPKGDPSELGGGGLDYDDWHEETETDPHDDPDDVRGASALGALAGVGSGAYKAVSAVTMWRVDTHKYLSTHTSDHMIHSIAINPDDSYLSVASGNKFIRYLKTVGAQLDEVPFLKRLLERTYHFRAHVWIDAHLLAALSEESEVLIFAKGSLKQIISHQFTPATDKLLSIVPYRDGFFCGSQEGTLIQVIPAKASGGGPAVVAGAKGESTGLQNPEDGVAALPQTAKERAAAAAAAANAALMGVVGGGGGGRTGSSSGSAVGGPGNASNSPKLFKVNNEFSTHKGALTHMVVSPSDSLLVCSVRDHGLATFPLDPMGKWSEFEAEPELSDILMPAGDVVAMDACEQRSIVATASSDHTVSIWSHFKSSPRASPCAIRHTFNEMPLAVAFHPGGYQILIGFATHIGLFHLLRNSIKLSYSFQLYTRTVTPLHIQYSHGGDRFAVGTGVHLFVYSSKDFSLLQHIPGNTGIINSMQWSSDDSVLASANAEGALYAWDLKTLTRVAEHVEKGVEFHTMCLDWGKAWAKHSYNALHHANTGGAGQGAHGSSGGGRGSMGSAEALTSDDSHSGTGGERRSGSARSGGGAGADSHPLHDRAQILAAGATFTSYRLKSLSAAGGAQDVRAHDFSPTSVAVSTAGSAAPGSGSSPQPGEELALDRISITHLIRDPQRNLVIAGTSTGYILLLRWPFKSLPRSGGAELGLTASLGAGGAPALNSLGLPQSSSPFDALHANVLGKFLVHEGPVLHMVLMPLAGVVLSYGADGNLFVNDLRTLDAKSLMGSTLGLNLAKQAGLQLDKLLGHTRSGTGAGRGADPSEAALTRNRILASLQLLAAHQKSYKSFKLSSALLPKSLSNAPAPWQAHLYTGDADLILVRNSEYESILQEIRENSQDVKRMERTAEYQMSAQKDFYIQNLKTLRSDMEALLASREQELSTTKNLLKISETEKSAALQQHKLDVAELNNNWRATLEKKMHESYINMERKSQEIASIKQQAAERERSAAEESAAKLSAAQSEATARESALQTRIAELELSLRESEASYEEALEQIEGEHDVQVAGLEQHSAAARARTREGTAILAAEVSAAKRKLEEKNESWKALEALSNEREDQLQHLASVIRKLTTEMTHLKNGLREKEEHITRRQHDLAQARQDNGTLKNFLEILEHRIAELENRETPALETMIALKQQVEHMSAELFELNKAKLAAQNLAVMKQGESTRFSITANNLRHKLAKKEHAWESVQKELKYIVEHLGHGSGHAQKSLMSGSSSSSTSGAVNVHVDLKALYQNYFASAGGSEPEQPDRSLIEKVENEATRQRNFLEKSLARLRGANASLATRTKADGEKALARAIHSLYEINRLREENQRLYQRCGLYRSMVVQAGLGKKLDMIDGGEEGAALLQIEAEATRDAFAAAHGTPPPAPGSAFSKRERRGSSGASSKAEPQSTSKRLMPGENDSGSGAADTPTSSVRSQRGVLAGSQSSAILPSVPLPGARALQSSASQPSLGQYDDFGARPDTSTSQRSGTSSASGLRGRDGKGPGVRAASPTRGSTKALAENSSLKARASELERRLEQVNQHVSLQAVHISALQTAIKANTAESAASRAEDLTNEQLAGFSGDEGEDEDTSPIGGGGNGNSSSHFFKSSPSPTSASGGTGRSGSGGGSRSASRSGGGGKLNALSPLQKRGGGGAGDRAVSPPLQPQEHKTADNSGFAGSGVSGQTLRGSNSSSSIGLGRPASLSSSRAAPLSPLDHSYSSMQSNIESTLASAGTAESNRSKSSGREGGIAAALDAAKNKTNSATRSKR